MSPTPQLLQGRYRLDRLIGRGGMADVYRAVDERDGAVVAVKILRSGDAGLARRLAQEARALARLDHPGLVRLFGCEVDGSEAHLVMELVEAPTLAERLREGALGAAATARLGATVAGTLAYVHSQGVVHRDVKPSNILLPEEGPARLADFGIARLLDATTMTLDHTTLGTAAYMAPEQLEDTHVGPVADVWSLGIVLLECLTGRRVYEGLPTEILARRLASPVPVTGELPVAWRVVLTGMLDHRPYQRLTAADVEEFLQARGMQRATTPRPPVPEDATSTVPIDLRGLAGAGPVAAGALVAADATTPAPQLTAPGVAATATERWDQAAAPVRSRWHTFGWAAALVLVTGGAGAAVGLGLRSTPATAPRTTTTKPPAALARTSTTVPRSSTTTTAPPPTTTTVPTATAALATLVENVGTDVRGGTIDPAHGQQVTTAAEQAVQDDASGSPAQAAQDLQQAAAALAAGETAGSVQPAAGTQLQGDLEQLGAALDLAGASAPPTTTTTTAPPTPPKHHHGGGNGNSGG